MYYIIADPKEDPSDKPRQIGIFVSRTQAAEYINDSLHFNSWVIKEWHQTQKERSCQKR